MRNRRGVSERTINDKYEDGQRSVEKGLDGENL